MAAGEKILVVAPAWVGDLVMAQSLLIALKAREPGARVTVLAAAWAESLLARMPEVDGVAALPVGHGEFKLGVRRRVGRALKMKNFDRAIVLPNSFKSALTPWFAKIPLRTGYLGEQRYGLLNDIRRVDERATPMNVQRFVALGFPSPSPSSPPPSPLAPPSSPSSSPSSPSSPPSPPPQPKLNVAAAADTAAKFNLDADAEVVALCPGAEFGPAKRWPAEYFAEVARDQLRHGRRVWLFGGDGDRAVAAHINALAGGRCDDLTGRTTLGDAADLLSRARHVVTNDSGLMHIAAAVGCHVVALYGSSSDAFTPPLTERADRLTLALDCAPCFRRTCPLGHLHCLNGLRPAMVLSAIASSAAR